MPREALHIVLTAGEASGDSLGGRLMRALKAAHEGPIVFSGIGGPQMEAEGLASLFPMQDLAVMGVMEVVPKIGLILRRIAQTVRFIEEQKPDIVITIDAPDFSFRVAKAVQRTGNDGPLWVHYVAPSVWAWRPERAAKVATLYDGLICLLPFEPPWFTAAGMSAAFTGHPAIENIKGLPAGGSFRRKFQIPDEAFVLGVLFGSRTGELKRMGQILRDSVFKALDSREAPRSLHIVAPTLPHLQERVEDLLHDMPRPVHVLTAAHDKWPAFAGMDAAVAVSGTVGLELAVSGVPHVIAYRVNRLTYEIVRRKIKVKFAHLANILLDEAVVPEFIQDRCTPDLIAPALLSLFDSNGAAATAQRTAFLNLRSKLSGAGTGLPSEQAARYVLDLAFQTPRRGVLRV